MSNWRNLERELIDILRQRCAPIEDMDGEPYLADYDMNGTAYGRISIEEIAKELDARGFK